MRSIPSLSADNAAAGTNKDTAFLRRHITQIRAFSLFCTETQDPAARPPRVAAPVPAATRGFAPFAAAPPLQAGQAEGSCPARCQGVSFPAPAARGTGCAPRGRGGLRAAAGMGQGSGLFCSRAKRREPRTCGRWTWLWLCPSFKGELSPFGQGLGASGVAESAPCTTLAVMLRACGQFTCFQISLQVLKFSPDLF